MIRPICNLKKSVINPIVISMALLPGMIMGGISIRGNMTHEINASPGEVYRGTITILNDSTESHEVEIYQTDYSFTFEGKSEFAQPAGYTPHSNALWITFNSKRIMIPADEYAIVNYAVQVPDTGILVGTYWSTIMVESIPKIDPEQKNEGISIRTIMRYGIQIITHIGDSGSRILKFLGAKVIKDSEKRFLNVDIQNIGERLLRPLVWVEFFNTEGNHICKLNSRIRRTYPGTSIRQQFDITTLQPGLYKALIVADCGGGDIYGINYTIKIEQ